MPQRPCRSSRRRRVAVLCCARFGSLLRAEWSLRHAADQGELHNAVRVSATIVHSRRRLPQGRPSHAAHDARPQCQSARQSWSTMETATTRRSRPHNDALFADRCFLQTHRTLYPSAPSQRHRHAPLRDATARHAHGTREHSARPAHSLSRSCSARASAIAHSGSSVDSLARSLHLHAQLLPQQRSATCHQTASHSCSRRCILFSF